MASHRAGGAAMTSSCDLVVVGAGPTGLTLALQATMFGAHVRIIERRTGPRVWAPALAIHPRTMEILRGLGVADGLLSRGLRSVDLEIHVDGSAVEGSLADLHLPATEYPFVFFAPQPEVEAVLRQKLASLGVDVEWTATFDGFEPREDGLLCSVAVDGDERLISARYLVGCDGADSTVRRETHIPFRGRSYRESILIADLGPTDGLDSGTAHAF
ncbi:MAG TPA: FAD-dependent monooxygenase, partial [Acidimicrobiia bacterium]